MEKKIKILIAVILLIILVGIIMVMMMTVNYERIDITPNGTSIEVPANQTKYHGDFDGIKIWNWKDGALITYNSHEGGIGINLNGLSFNALSGLIKNGELQNADGFECYVINADDLVEVHLLDIIKLNYNGKFYCIPLTNETTHDNIIIFSKDRDMALHMAKSVQYKNVYPNSTKSNNLSIENITGDLESKANDYLNNADLNDIKSTVEEKTGDLLSKNPVSI